jgi:lipoprotein-anchoring transpeptidase ErfK/SrfK
MGPRALLAVLAVLPTTCRSAPEPAPAPVTAPASASASASAPASAPVTVPASAADPRCPGGWTCDYDAFDRQPNPAITKLFVQKHAHMLHLVAGEIIVKSFTVAIGSGGHGYKRHEGDRVTPIGTYTITGRYPSRWHTYLAISYPNDEDRRRFEDLVTRGEVDRKVGPGSAIAIHGRRKDMWDGAHKAVDWTLGCVALDNGEIDEVAAMAPVGTTVVIAD